MVSTGVRDVVSAPMNGANRIGGRARGAVVALALGLGFMKVRDP